MTPVKVWQERVEIPTYETGPQDIHPMFLENRVYQGSSGAVYPYGVTDTLSEQKTLKSWQAVWLENDYIKVMILPELGGRVHRAWDKVKQRDFVYHNEVIKPALVGLLGPWISGGIEFNWPQHHRPTTFMPVDFTLEAHEDGAQTVWVGETEPMHGLQVMTGFTLRPDRAALEIASRVYNGNATPRHFLWWANPAVKGGEGHQSVFPPDVTAVFDHGKRAVSAFPIATGKDRGIAGAASLINDNAIGSIKVGLASQLLVGADTNTVNHHISLKRFPTLQRQFYFFTIDHMFNGIIEQNAHTSLLVAL